MRGLPSFFVHMNEQPVLITLDYPPERGGVARYLGALVSASKGAFRVVVDEQHSAEGPGDVTQRRMFQRAWPHWWPLVKVCREFKNSKLILVSHALPAGTAAWLAHRFFGGAAYAVLCHGLDIRLASKNARKRWLFRTVCSSASLVITNSDATAQQLAAIAPSVKPFILTPGVEPCAFPSREDARARLGIAHNELVILSVARLIPRKGIDVLLEAAKGLNSSRPLRIIIVGDGPELESLQKLADTSVVRRPTSDEEATNDDRRTTIEFHTNADDTTLNSYYSASDIFCIPVKDDPQDMEGFGIVYLEAALAGLPSVATTSGGVPEAVENGKTGLLVPPNDIEALRVALQKLIDDEPLRHALGAAGRVRAKEDFRWEDRWKKLEEALRITD